MRFALLVVLMASLAGCGVSSSGASPTATPTTSPTAPPTTTPVPKARPTPTPVIGRDYAAFLTSMCRAFARKDANAVTRSLPYYQYNSGLRYGYLGDGEGQTGDPSLMQSWLGPGRVRCQYFTPDLSGHGVVLTNGWPVQNGRWSLVEMDIFGGHWKINDLTFGSRAALYRSLTQTARPILQYRG